MKIFHHNDLDGRLSAFIVKHYTQDIDSIFIESNYNIRFPMESVEKDEEVWIVDYSISPEEMYHLLEITENVTWIDHHKTSLAKYSDFKKYISGIRYDGLAGCVLTYMYMSRYYAAPCNWNAKDVANFDQENIPKFIRLVGDYDVWKWEFGVETDLFMNGLKSYDTRPDSIIWEELTYNGTVLDKLVKEGTVIKRYLTNFNRDYVNSWAFEVDFEGYNCIALNFAQCGSQVFDSVKDKNYDIMISFVWDGENFNISLYTTKDIDVSEIAKKYGGGGHKSASGMSLDYDLFVEIVGEKNLNKIGLYKIVNKTTGKYYIGSTLDSFRKRFSKHKRRLRKNVHENGYLQKAWNKYGESDFKFEIEKIIENKKEVRDLEKVELLKFAEDRSKCYNLTLNVGGGNTLDDLNTKQKHSDNLKKSYTTELRQIRREQGLKRRDVIKSIFENSKKTDMWKENHTKGMLKLSKRPEWLKVVRERSEKMRKKVKTDRGEIFNSITEAAKVLGAARSSIRQCLKGKQKTCLGRNWSYLKE